MPPINCSTRNKPSNDRRLNFFNWVNKSVIDFCCKSSLSHILRKLTVSPVSWLGFRNKSITDS